MEMTADDFSRLFRYFEHTAVRLEVQPRYNVAVEQEMLAGFLAGDRRPPTVHAFFADWCAQVREVTASGRRVERVRVLTHRLPAAVAVGRPMEQRSRRGHAVHGPINR